MLDLRSVGRGFESWPPAVQCNPGQVVNARVPLVTKQYNLVPANGRWCLAAGKVTVGLASHWPRVTVTDISGSSMGSRHRRGRLLSTLVQHGRLYLYLHMYQFKVPWHDIAYWCWKCHWMPTNKRTNKGWDILAFCTRHINFYNCSDLMLHSPGKCWSWFLEMWKVLELMTSLSYERCLL